MNVHVLVNFDRGSVFRFFLFVSVLVVWGGEGVDLIRKVQMNRGKK